MKLTYRRLPSILIGLSLTWTMAFSQRRVEVHTGEPAELRHTAHRLGVSVERVRQGRRLLERATDLLEDVAGQRPVEPLASAWIRLNPERAPGQIRGILDRLRALAAANPEPTHYEQLTRDAGAILAVLKALDPDTDMSTIKEWPAPPEEGGASGEGEARDRLLEPSLQAQEHRLYGLAHQDAEAAVELLAEIEQGQPRPVLRSRLMWGLAQQGRLDHANRMLDELIEHTRYLPPQERTELEMALFYAYQYRPERASELVSLWTEHIRSLPSEGPPQVIQGVELTPAEYQTLELLGTLGRFATPLVEESLRGLPELQEKLRAMGGLQRFTEWMLEQRSSAAREEADSRRRIARQVNESAQPDGSSQAEILEQLQWALQAARESAQRDDWKAVRRSLEAAGRLLDALDTGPAKLGVYQRLAGLHLALNGELPAPLLDRGWRLLDEASAAQQEGHWASEAPAAPHFPVATAQPDEMEEWLLAVWAWSDFGAADANLKGRDEATRFGASLRFVRWLADGYRAVPRDFY